MNGVLDSVRLTLREMIERAVKGGMEKMRASSAAGIPTTLYLYYKQSSASENGILVLLSDAEPCPPGLILATGEGLRCNVPYEQYYRWIYERVGRLPILAWEED